MLTQCYLGELYKRGSLPVPAQLLPRPEAIPGRPGAGGHFPGGRAAGGRKANGQVPTASGGRKADGRERAGTSPGREADGRERTGAEGADG